MEHVPEIVLDAGVRLMQFLEYSNLKEPTNDLNIIVKNHNNILEKLNEYEAILHHLKKWEIKSPFDKVIIPEGKYICLTTEDSVIGKAGRVLVENSDRIPHAVMWWGVTELYGPIK